MMSEKEIEAAREAWREYWCEEDVPRRNTRDGITAALEAAARVRAEADAGEPVAESIESYYRRQIEWSRNTFGPGTRTKGVIDHIRKELAEIEAEPDDLSEWVDVIILAMDGFWRHGGSADDLMPRLLEKQRKNFARKWPDWRTMSPDKAIEHDRSCDARPAPQPSESKVLVERQTLEDVRLLVARINSLHPIESAEVHQVYDEICRALNALAAGKPEQVPSRWKRNRHECPTCVGSGEIAPDAECPDCDGTGACVPAAPTAGGGDGK